MTLNKETLDVISRLRAFASEYSDIEFNVKTDFEDWEEIDAGVSLLPADLTMCNVQFWISGGDGSVCFLQAKRIAALTKADMSWSGTDPNQIGMGLWGPYELEQMLEFARAVAEGNVRQAVILFRNRYITSSGILEIGSRRLGADFGFIIKGLVRVGLFERREARFRPWKRIR